MILVVPFVLAFLAYIVIHTHLQRLQHLEDPEVNGVWIILYNICKLDYNVCDYKEFQNRVLRSDYATWPSKSAKQAECELLAILYAENPHCKVEIISNHYCRNSK